MENIIQMVPTPYSDLNAVLQDLVDSLQKILGDNFVGAYLQGSFAVGDFDHHRWLPIVAAGRLNEGIAELEAWLLAQVGNFGRIKNYP